MAVIIVVAEEWLWGAELGPKCANARTQAGSFTEHLTMSFAVLSLQGKKGLNVDSGPLGAQVEGLLWKAVPSN